LIKSSKWISIKVIVSLKKLHKEKKFGRTVNFKSQIPVAVVSRQDPGGRRLELTKEEL